MTRKILGIDPGLQRTGWGVVTHQAGRLSYVAAGIITTDTKAENAARLAVLWHGLQAVLNEHAPDLAAVEETFVNKNSGSSLKLGQARGIALAAPAVYGIPVAEFAANTIKKTITGVGHAEKQQIQAMIRILLPAAPENLRADAADALAIAITCALHAKIL